MDSLIFLPFVLCLGLALGLSLWLLANLVLAVPDEDRSYLDQPPLGFRLCWWGIHILAWYIQDHIPVRLAVRLEQRLQKAGLDYVLTPAQLLGGQCMGLLVGGAGGWGIALILQFQGHSLPFGLAALGFFYPLIWMGERISARSKDLLKTLPFYLDIVTLCVEAGLNLNGALKQATLKGPPGVLREEFQRILRDIRAGKLRAEALRSFAARVGEPSVTTLVSSIVQAESLGMSLGPMLRAQAEQRRLERFLRAEKLAMEAPVKMLLPLVAFIFPCTFVVLGFPIVMMFKDIQ